MEVQIEDSWKEVLKQEFSKNYFIQIVNHIKTEKLTNAVIYPKGSLIFNAFTQTPFNNVKVVILGQDPYHNVGQAMGLSFSVPDDISIPPSLQNIFKELHKDIGMQMPKTGNLTAWAKQGVLLLNTVLTVRANEPASHSKIGWTNFTDAVIRKLSEEKKNLVFLLWGKYAQEKQILIDESKHTVLKAAHPSPLSAYNGFFGCKHFSQTNEVLTKNSINPIDWILN